MGKHRRAEQRTVLKSPRRPLPPSLGQIYTGEISVIKQNRDLKATARGPFSCLQMSHSIISTWPLSKLRTFARLIIVSSLFCALKVSGPNARITTTHHPPSTTYHHHQGPVGVVERRRDYAFVINAIRSTLLSSLSLFLSPPPPPPS